MAFTYAELFAGAGGLSMGLEVAGWEPVAHAEIEPHARAVLREHWPDCRLDGDVSQVNGADYAGVTLLSGGSPCQDLSVAGKRAGMTEGSGTRSSLYFEQVRIRDESGAPYFLWENVLGAFSSNNGRDFAAVLSALVGAAIAVPADGWESAGVAAGPTGVAAWRVLDCQFFGPPQRRRRVFVLGARAGGVDPAEVLAVGEGLLGDPAPGGEAGEEPAGDAGGGADGAEYISLVLGSDPISRVGGASQPVTGRNGDPGVVLAVNISDGATVNTMAGDHQNRVTDYTAIVLRNREGKPGGGKGPLLSEERSLTRASANDQVLFTMASGQAKAEITRDKAPTLTNTHDGAPIVFPTIDATDATKWGSNQWVDRGKVVPGIPRRLMPIETERLMGWPDGHTEYGIAEDGTRYALSDTARYRLCGNGVASPVAAWIGWRLREAIEGQAAQ